MKRALVIGVTMAALSILLWKIGSESSGRGTEAQVGEESSVPNERAEEEARALSGPVDETPEREAVPALEGPPATNEPAQDGFEAPLRDGRKLTVVSARTGAWVPHAVVLYLPEREFDGSARGGGALSDYAVEQQLEARGRRYRADAEGGLFVPAGEPALVAAGATELWGWRELEGDLPTQIELQADPPLRVRVVGPDGAGVAGVGIGLWKPHFFTTTPTLEVLTDAEGRATFARPRNLIAQFRGPADLRPITLVRDVEKRQVSASEIPPDELVWRLPATGSIEVRMTEADGTPLESLNGVMVSGLFQRSTAVQWGVTDGGTAHFPFVSLGEPVTFMVTFQDGTPRIDSTVDGPTEPGEHVVVELARAGNRVEVAFDLVGPDGAPLSSRKVTLQFERETLSANEKVTARTDSTGRIRRVLEADRLPAALRLVHLAGSTHLAGRLPIPADLGPGVHDLGELTLTAPGLLVSGRVLDDRGEPIANARVTPLRGTELANGKTLWRPQRTSAVVTDGAGAFELRGDASDPFGIQAAASGAIEGPQVEVPVGTEGFEYVLERAASLTGRVLHDPLIDPRLIGVYVHRAGEDERVFASGLGRDGSFAFIAMKPGLYDVHFGARSSGERIGVVPNVRVDYGLPAQDPRLDPFDARGLLNLIKVVARTPTGSPSRLESWMRPSEGGGAWQRLPQGAIEVTTTASALDFTLFSPGFELVELEAVTGTREVMLSPGIPMEVSLGAQAPALPQGVKLVVRLSTEGPLGSLISVETDLDAGGRATVRAPRIGTYTAYLIVGSEGRLTFAIGSPADLGKVEQMQVEVPAAGGSVVLDFDETELAEEIQEAAGG